jgi:hypothetical protein
MMLHDDSHLSDAELLSSADDELTAPRQREVRAHLAACWTCRTRMAELDNAIAKFTTSYRSVFDRLLPPAAGPAARLRSGIAQRLPASPFSSSASWRWQNSLLALVLLCIFFFATIFPAKHRLHSGIVPNPELTPGEATFTSRTEVCQGNTQSVRRPIPEALKQAVFAEYGVKDAPRDAYEVDFLITPELGGSASIRNLWPQPYFVNTWNAHVKDALEERLHKLVCNGDLDLSTAQREIATNWVDAYKKYVRTDAPM